MSDHESIVYLAVDIDGFQLGSRFVPKEIGLACEVCRADELATSSAEPCGTVHHGIIDVSGVYCFGGISRGDQNRYSGTISRVQKLVHGLPTWGDDCVPSGTRLEEFSVTSDTPETWKKYLYAYIDLVLSKAVIRGQSATPGSRQCSAVVKIFILHKGGTEGILLRDYIGPGSIRVCGTTIACDVVNLEDFACPRAEVLLQSSDWDLVARMISCTRETHSGLSDKSRRFSWMNHCPQAEAVVLLKWARVSLRHVRDGSGNFKIECCIAEICLPNLVEIIADLLSDTKRPCPKFYSEWTHKKFVNFLRPLVSKRGFVSAGTLDRGIREHFTGSRVRPSRCSCEAE